jgi:hypothetical protein
MHEADEPGLMASAASMLRLLFAWAFTALGLLNLAMGIDSLAYLIFHVVLLGAGLVLLALGLLAKRPRLPAYVAAVVAGGLGLVLSTIPSTTAAACCLTGSTQRHGYPFTIVGGGHFDGYRTVADLLFWGCVGLFALLLATVLTPAHRPARHHSTRRHGHAEQRARIADDENVGGLP